MHKLASCFIAALVLALSLPVAADTLQGRVVSIADGDTVTVLDAENHQWKIRLMGIDAPEKKMPFGQRSKQALSDMVFNMQVVVEYSKRDKYGRAVGKIIVEGIDANLKQIKAGMAWHYKQYAKEQPAVDREAYSTAEVEARASGKGLWADNNPIPPWDWRKELKVKR